MQTLYKQELQSALQTTAKERTSRLTDQKIQQRREDIKLLFLI